MINTDQPIIQGADICKYIPQRSPIVMVDSFYGLEGNTSVSGLTIEENNMFCVGGRLLDGGLIEHIAQSGAMQIGYMALSQGAEVPLGFIGSINKLSISRLPEAGEKLHTTITFEAQVGDITLVGATVRVADEVIAQGKMKVATR
jgi:predicted hotdog family 3-hydroxylacyl-ACP dehydratase